MYQVLILSFLFSFYSFGHPVIYKGGFVYQGQFAPDMNRQRASYTLHPKYAIETNTHWFQNADNYRDYTAGVNFLFKRWLNEDSQGNLYGGAHIGFYDDDNDSGLTHHLMLSGDWESRHLYTAGTIMRYGPSERDDFYRYTYRFGFAPYVAGMNTLQNWLILKLDYIEENNRTLMVTPLMRFFYKNVLWEIGSTTRGDYFLTLMVHY